MIEINLLPTQNVLSKREQTVRRGFLWVVGVALALFVFDLIVFFLFQQLFKRQIGDLTTRRNGLTAQAEQLKSLANDLKTVEEKADGVILAKDQRRDMAVTLTQVNQIFIDGTEMSSLQVLATGGFSVAMKVNGVESLGRFINTVAQASSKLNWHQVGITGLRQEAGDSYSFQLTAASQPVKVEK